MATREELENVKAYVDERGKIHIDNALIVSKNFAGAEKRNPLDPKEIVNTKGNRNFSIELNKDAADLISNFRLTEHPDKAYRVQVKLPKPDAEDQTPRIFMTVKVRYNYDSEGKPYRNNPKIRQYSSKGMTEKTEKNVDTIDEVYIEKADLVFSPYPWEKFGKVGLTAFLTQLNYKIKENEMNAKWDQDYSTDTPDDFEEVPFD